MYTMNLNWICIPSLFYNALYNHDKSMYMLFFGPGLYQYIYYTRQKKYQTYYIGMSDGELGHRLNEHYKEYISGRWWIPNDMEEYRNDIYACIRKADKDDYRKYFFRSDSGGVKDKKVLDACKEITEDSYILIASVYGNDGKYIKKAEAILHNALLKKNDLYGEDQYRSGWFGDTHSVIPDEKIKIINNYPNDEVKKMASSVWDVIECKGGDVTKG